MNVDNGLEVVHLTFPHHIISVQENSGAYYITGQWERVQNKTIILTLTLTLNVPLPSIVFIDRGSVFIMIFEAFSYGIFTAYISREEEMSVRLSVYYNI